MRSRAIGRRHLLRLEPGEEILTELRAFARAEGLPAAWLSGLGAVDDIRVAFYDVSVKAYRSYRRTGLIEILSLTGNLAWRGDEPVVHIHVSAAHETEGAFGGHLDAGIVSATVEVLVDPLEARVERAPVPEIGLALLDLPERLRP